MIGEGYTLVICEKPDAARRVSEALSDGRPSSQTVEGTTVYRLMRGKEEFVVCAAQGHVYGVSDPADERNVYPVFDVEWYAADAVGDDAKGSSRRIDAIRRLSDGASRFVNACDFDVEGETIGFNILRYACGGKEGGALRAKFSTLTKEDLIRAFDEAESQEGQGLARAGRTRHEADFIWGVNLSRVLSQAARRPAQRYRTVSIGRVQGPTLGFLVDRERAVRSFVPTPRWSVTAEFLAGGRSFTAEHVKSPMEVMKDAQRTVENCIGSQGIVKSMSKKTVEVGPPVPFNLGDLQKEAYRAFGFPPSRTMRIAERLYLDALISYPRTGSQYLPPSIGFEALLGRLGRMKEYSHDIDELLRMKLRPTQGSQYDQAHPAIHPTGDVPKRSLERAEASLFDLVVRRFLAVFGPNATREVSDLVVGVGEDGFRMVGQRTLKPGWMKYYGRYSRSREVEIPAISEGQTLKVENIRSEEKFDEGPDRFSQASLLQRMEAENIGTKATRADAIQTLLDRGYVSGQRMEVTDLGISVFETLEEHASQVTSTELTRGLESRLEAIEKSGGGEAELLRETVRTIAAQLVGMNANEEALGNRIAIATAASVAAPELLVLGTCPVCKTGKLRVVKSRKTGKRFVGCSNYPSGCRASAPLPQRGSVRPVTKPCPSCGWPMVAVFTRRAPWKLCVNVACPAKRKKSH